MGKSRPDPQTNARIMARILRKRGDEPNWIRIGVGDAGAVDLSYLEACKLRDLLSSTTRKIRDTMRQNGEVDFQ